MNTTCKGETSFYVYIHKRKTDGRVFYVGKGCDDRAWSLEGRNRSWFTAAVEHGREVVIVASGISSKQALFQETMFISLYRNLGEPLVNIHSGRLMSIKSKEPVQRRRFNAPEFGSLDKYGVKKFLWRRNARTSEWIMRSIDEMRKAFGGSVQDWQDVVDGFSQVGPKGWRLNLKKVRA